MKYILAGILTGIAAGLIGALCGVGGGILMVPVFTRLLDLGQKQAVATSLAVIILTSIVATVQNLRSPTPLIHWPLFAACAAGSIVATWYGAEAMRGLRDDTLTRIFAAVMVIMGVWMWISPSPPAPASSKAEPAEKPKD